MRMKRKELDNGGDGVSHHRHTFDRVCTTNEFVGAEPVKRYDSARGISLHDPNYFRIILPPIYYASGTAERVSPIPTFLRNLSLSLCLILESVGKNICPSVRLSKKFGGSNCI